MNDQTAGGIVVRNKKICLISQSRMNKPYWVIPKGHIEKGETIEQTAKREIFEETGLNDIKQIKKIGIITRLGGNNKGGWVPKDIHCFLYRTKQKQVKTNERSIKPHWMNFQKVISLLYFKEERSFLLEHKKELGV